MAASNILLKKNVIHSRQIAPGAVHGSDIAKGAVSRHHLRKQLRGEVTYDGPLPVAGTYFGTGKMQLTNGPTGTVTVTIGWSGSKMTSFSVGGYASGFCDWPTASPTDASYQTFPGGIWDYGASEQSGQNYLTANGSIGGTQALTLIVSSVGFSTNAGVCQSQGPITTSVMNAP